jgi:hypothetical protein
MFLVNSGVSVAKSPRGATEIDFEIQAVKFGEVLAQASGRQVL